MEKLFAAMDLPEQYTWYCFNGYGSLDDIVKRFSISKSLIWPCQIWKNWTWVEPDLWHTKHLQSIFFILLPIIYPVCRLSCIVQFILIRKNIMEIQEPLATSLRTSLIYKQYFVRVWMTLMTKLTFLDHVWLAFQMWFTAKVLLLISAGGLLIERCGQSQGLYAIKKLWCLAAIKECIV